jgi:(4-alkanoyl-5-oxo-2,5-dihydrofuran-3-yl)methyl phosphate reductase
MILVTGATGEVGGEVVRQLVARGLPVRALARDPAKAAAKLDPAVEVAKGDLLQPETFAAALGGVSKLFLMAGAQELPRVAEHAVPAAKRAGVAHVVLLSSSTTLVDPPLAIGRWHRAAEVLLEGSGMAWTFVRPGNFASNAMRWAPTIKAQGVVYAPAAGARSAPIDPYDIASVAALTLAEPGHEGKKHVVTGEENLTTEEQVAIIGAAIGKALRFVEVPLEGARAGLQRAGMDDELADAILELMTRARGGGDAARTSTVRDVTGRAPRPFAEWVRNHVAAFS